MQEDQECFKCRQKFPKGLQSARATKEIFNKLSYIKIFLKILHENISRSLKKKNKKQSSHLK